MTVDRELVTRKLVLITHDLDHLRGIHDRGLGEYLASATDQAVVERLVERTVTRMIDINYHVITAAGHPPPADYHASFLLLGPLGLLDPAFARRIARSAGLRNRLVHEYEELDHQLVFEALGDALGDVPAYVAAVDAFIRNPQQPSGR